MSNLQRLLEYLECPSGEYWISGDPSSEVASVISSNQGLSSKHGRYACQNVSLLWARKFREAGIEDIEIHDGMYRGEGHTWLEVEGLIFDPTAGQFDDFPEIDEFEYDTHSIRDSDL